MDYLRSLAVFVRVAELGSFSAAAEAFEISGTMVGKHVQFLEDRLGGRLIERTTRRQSLTDLGATFCERARAILADVEAADLIGEELQRSPRGLLRVSAPTGLGIEVLIDAIAEFRLAHPQVSIELSINDRVVDVVEEGFHVAIRTGEHADDSLVARPLAPYRVIACASPAYLASRPPLADPEDLAQHDCLAFTQWGRKPVWRFGRDGETRSVAIAGAFASDNVVALRRAAIAGMGIAVQAEALVGEALADGRLRQVLPDWTLRARPTFIVWPQHMRASARLRSFVEFITARLG